MVQKVLYIIDNISAGGVSQQSTALAAGLDKTRFQAQVLAFYGVRAGRTLHFAHQLRDASIPYTMLDLKYNPLDKARALWGIIQAAWQFRPDIIHTVDYHGGILIGMARPFLPPGIKIVVSVLAENTDTQIKKQQRSWQGSHAVTVNSPHLKEELVQRAEINADKITVVPNGIDLVRFSQDFDPALTEKLKANASCVLLMVARIVPRKGVALLPQALGLLKLRGEMPPNIKAYIVGESTDLSAQAELEYALVGGELQDVIVLHPQTDRIAAFYHAANFTVLASRWGEGLPGVLIESLAAGRPVIVSEAANRANVIEHGKTGWVFRTDDVLHLADTLRNAFALPPAELHAMQQACIDASGKYSFQNMVNHYQSVYDHL